MLLKPMTHILWDMNSVYVKHKRTLATQASRTQNLLRSGSIFLIHTSATRRVQPQAIPDKAGSRLNLDQTRIGVLGQESVFMDRGSLRSYLRPTFAVNLKILT